MRGLCLEGLIYVGRFARRFQNRLCSGNLRLKIYVSNLQNVLTETCLEDEDLSKT